MDGNSVKLYRAQVPLTFAVEANSRREAMTIILRLTEDVRCVLPVGVSTRFTRDQLIDHLSIATELA